MNHIPDYRCKPIEGIAANQNDGVQYVCKKTETVAASALPESLFVVI
jgi:hypothetical protein